MRHIVHGHAEPRLVRTPAYDKISALLEKIVPIHDVGAVVGRTGVGKTYLTEMIARDTGKRVVYVDLPRAPARKELLVRLYRALTGKILTSENYLLTFALEEKLADSDAIIIIDEVQGLDDIGLDQLTHLHGQENAHWTLLLVGSEKAATKLRQYEHLASRLERIVKVDRLQGEALIQMLRGFHPIFEHTPHALLLQLDSEMANGDLREWARFLRTLAALRERLPTPFELMDRKVAAAALHTHLHGAAVGQ